MTKKVTDIRSKMTPNWIEKGRAVLDSLSEQDQENIVAFVFNLVLEDVRAGLKGEEAEVFFEMIDKELQKSHANCYFSDYVDGNAVGFTKDTKMCVLCTVKIRNILRAFGIKVDDPKTRRLH